MMNPSKSNTRRIIIGVILSFLCFLYMVNPLFGFGTFLYGCYDSSMMGNILLNIVLPTVLMILIIAYTSLLSIRNDFSQIPLAVWVLLLSFMVSITVIYMTLIYHFIAPAAYDFSLDATSRYLGFRINFIFSFIAIPACCFPLIVLIARKVRNEKKEIRQN